VVETVLSFDQYLAHESTDPTADGVTYQQATLWLTDTDMTALLTEIRAAVTARLDRDPAQNATRRMIRKLAGQGIQGQPYRRRNGAGETHRRPGMQASRHR
jgi:hypothetical protein